MRKAALFLSLLSCALPAVAQDDVGGKKVYRTAEPSIWTGDLTKGMLTHKMTGTAFPEKIEGYKRKQIFSLGEGDDVGVSYEGSNGLVTIYLFKPGAMPEHKLKGAISSFAATHKQAFVWSNGAFTVDAPQKLRFFKATYKTGVGPNTLMDYLYFGELGSWTVKVRATMMKADFPTEQAFDKIVRSLPWASVLQANGGCSGIACTVTGATAFDHHHSEMLLTTLLESSPENAAKLAGGSGTPLLSRKVGQREWRVSALPDALAQLFTDSFGALSISAPLYSLSWKEGGKTGIVRYFSGAPDQALFDREVDSLVLTPEESAFVPVANAVNYAPF